MESMMTPSMLPFAKSCIPSTSAWNTETRRQVRRFAPPPEWRSRQQSPRPASFSGLTNGRREIVPHEQSRSGFRPTVAEADLFQAFVIDPRRRGRDVERFGQDSRKQGLPFGDDRVALKIEMTGDVGHGLAADPTPRRATAVSCPPSSPDPIHEPHSRRFSDSRCQQMNRSGRHRAPRRRHAPERRRSENSSGFECRSMVPDPVFCPFP